MRVEVRRSFRFCCRIDANSIRKLQTDTPLCPFDCDCCTSTYRPLVVIAYARPARFLKCNIILTSSAILNEENAILGRALLLLSTTNPTTINGYYTMASVDIPQIAVVSPVQKMRLDTSQICNKCSLRGGGETRLLLCKACHAIWYCVSIISVQAMTFRKC